MGFHIFRQQFTRYLKKVLVTLSMLNICSLTACCNGIIAKWEMMMKSLLSAAHSSVGLSEKQEWSSFLFLWCVFTSLVSLRAADQGFWVQEEYLSGFPVLTEMIFVQMGNCALPPTMEITWCSKSLQRAQCCGAMVPKGWWSQFTCQDQPNSRDQQRQRKMVSKQVWQWNPENRGVQLQLYRI